MLIRLLSDLHMEFADFELPLLDTDKDTVLILAGDIDVMANTGAFTRVREWAMMNRFKKIIHICGNHEFYNGSFLRVRSKLRREVFGDDNLYGNIAIAQNKEIVHVDNVSFICATLWTNYNGGNPVIMEIIRAGLNDYRLIRTGNVVEPYLRRSNPRDFYHEHMSAKNFIFENIPKEKELGNKIVVVTHHAPSLKSINPMHDGDPINWGYASDYDVEITDAKPELWVHGHTHYCFDYKVGDTRVVCNPRGYARKVSHGYTEPPVFINQNQDFNPSLVLEV